MKIAHIYDNYGRGAGGGTEQSLPQLCTLLEAAGHANCVLYANDLGAKDEVQGRRLYRVPKLCTGSIRPDEEKHRLVREILQAEQPDVLHVHGGSDEHLFDGLARCWPMLLFVHNHSYTCPSGTRFYRRQQEVCTISPGVRCLRHVYGDGCASRKPTEVVASALRFRRFRRILEAAHAIAVDSDFMKRELVQSGVAEDRVHVSATVTELPALTDRSPQKNGRNVLFVGRLTPEKGLGLVLMSLAQVVAPWTLTVVGDGWSRRHFESLASGLGIADRVSFLGHVPKSGLAPFFRQSDVCVVPSLWPEPFGLVGPEAMAYSLPVVACDVGAIREWLSDGQTGFLVPAGDVRTFATSLELLLSDWTLREQMGNNGRQRLEQLFNPAGHVTTMIQLYSLARLVFSGRREVPDTAGVSR